MLYLRMKTKQLIKKLSTALAIPIIMCIFLVGGRAAAITCPDGHTLPDSQADQCGTATTSDTTTDTSSEITPINTGPKSATKGQCGSGDGAVMTSFDFGCKGATYPGDLNPIIDMAFAIFRFLSAGVGLVVIGSIIVAGIQYSTSRGNPQATQAAIKRITNALIGLMIYIFMFSIANFLVPGGMFL